MVPLVSNESYSMSNDAQHFFHIKGCALMHMLQKSKEQGLP